jgi:hypothetical protein
MSLVYTQARRSVQYSSGFFIKTAAPPSLRLDPFYPAFFILHAMKEIYFYYVGNKFEK